MKISNRNLLFCLVPLLAPLTASAETERQTERTPAASETRSSDASSASERRNDDTRSTPLTRGDATSATAETRNDTPSWRASQLMGTDVKNGSDESIGEVEDLVLDMKNGEVLAVIISSGGFLGIGESHSAVPVSSLSYDDNARTLGTTLTKEQLGKAPQFDKDEWSDHNDTSVTQALRSFRDSIDGDVSTRDNTTQTDRDYRRDRANRTGQEQSNDDATITREIRSYIADTELSNNAKNIVVSTRDEHVTLQGEVDSAAEHKAIIKIAEIYVDKARINDQLEVNSN